MEKVVSIKEADLNTSKRRKYALKGLTILLLGLSTMLTSCGINKKIVNEQQFAYEDSKYDDEVTIRVDNINLLLAKPVEEVVDGVTVLEPPGGYTMGPNNICYKLTVDDGNLPRGYTLSTDGKTIYQIDTVIDFYAPDGYILVGNKIVSVDLVENYDAEELIDAKIYGDYVISIEPAPLKKIIKV